MKVWLLCTAAGYLSGSIPFSWLIGLAMGVDIRSCGSGNPGATNLGRSVGAGWGVVGLILDLLKGLVPVLGSGWIMGYLGHELTQTEAWRWLTVAAAAIVGHIYPVWLKFKGGKGAATGLGVMLGLWPTLTLAALSAGLVWLVVLGITRYVSLASILAAISVPGFLVGYTYWTRRHPADMIPFYLVCSLLAGLVLVRHRANFARLLAGTEPKLHFRSPPDQRPLPH